MFDVLIIGGGVSGVSAALLLGSAVKKPYAKNKKIGIIVHQRASYLQNGVYNNVYGIKPKTLGTDLLSSSLHQLAELYPHVKQIEKEKVTAVLKTNFGYLVTSNKNEYKAKIVVVAINSNSPMLIKGLEDFVIPHQKAAPSKNRIQLKNTENLVTDGLYVAGTLAGCRSQLSIAAGSGANAAAEILTLWNNGEFAQVHDALGK
ncbi:FAD-dependent oxidoreductase [Flavobacterium sp.]|uniref:FAD-dependent oxidoreductase n=1 Tax=Flavobacterium sp. TaxID=239 RepID=UPI003528F309